MLQFSYYKNSVLQTKLRWCNKMSSKVELLIPKKILTSDFTQNATFFLQNNIFFLSLFIAHLHLSNNNLFLSLLENSGFKWTLNIKIAVLTYTYLLRLSDTPIRVCLFLLLEHFGLSSLKESLFLKSCT